MKSYFRVNNLKIFTLMLVTLAKINGCVGNLTDSTMSDINFQPPAPPSSSSSFSSALPTTAITTNTNTQMTNNTNSKQNNTEEPTTNIEIGITTKIPESKSLLLDADIDLKPDTELSSIPVAFTVADGDSVLTAAATTTTTTGKKAIVSKNNNSKFSLPKNHWTNAKMTDGTTSGSSSSSSSTTGGRRKPATHNFRPRNPHERHSGPFFEEPLDGSNDGEQVLLSAHLYTEAVLNCRVGMLHDKTVMWVKKTSEKVDLLTVANVTYSGDPRIQVKYQYPNNWRLIINPVYKSDAGLYMCQVSTHPPRVFTTNLTILEPPIRLIDDQEYEVTDRYYKTGSTIDLKCQVSRSFLIKEKSSLIKNQTRISTKSSVTAVMNSNALNTTLNEEKFIKLEKQFENLIIWSKDDEQLPTNAIKRLSSSEKWLDSRISIPDAKLSDTGNYSCSLGNLYRTIVQVQVLTGESPAAIQHNSTKLLVTPNIVLMMLLLSLILIIFPQKL